MSKLRFKISMSLDGFVAGPSQSVENPLGIGGGRLHEWAFQLAALRALLGLEGGEVNESTPVVEESLANLGATVMGRNMFGGHPGAWDLKNPWNGWWGGDPPQVCEALRIVHSEHHVQSTSPSLPAGAAQRTSTARSRATSFATWRPSRI